MKPTKVKELIEILGNYNPDADVFIHGLSTIKIGYGCAEGGDIKTCIFIDIESGRKVEKEDRISDAK